MNDGTLFCLYRCALLRKSFTIDMRLIVMVVL
jgi:hypothetical protein